MLPTGRCRFIPTCVGNTRYRPGSARHDPVHPHMRGEYAAAQFGQQEARGSSPHAWGILRRGSIMTEDSRFIPTCVGNTHPPAACGSPRPVHPHMRGEYVVVPSVTMTCSGSSPHAWGILPGCIDLQLPYRFIPTCVGNTQAREHHDRGLTVHPHMRGEYARQTRCLRELSGSSPHAWGIHAQGLAVVVPGRFIPTCVGNTTPSPPCLRPKPVHPHMRGEYDTNDLGDLLRTGSSPHAWGIRADIPAGIRGQRFIPTCVGNT